jgi:hypothetical protein
MDKKSLDRYKQLASSKKVILPEAYQKLQDLKAKLHQLKNPMPKFENGGNVYNPEDEQNQLIADENGLIVDAPMQDLPMAPKTEMEALPISEVSPELKEAEAVPAEDKKAPVEEKDIKTQLKELIDERKKQTNTAQWADALSGIAANFSTGVLDRPMKGTNFVGQAAEQTQQDISNLLKMAPKTTSESDKLKLDILKEKLKQMKMKPASEAVSSAKPTIGESMADRQFAKDVYVPFVAEGGFADAEKGLEQLTRVSDELNSGKNITGYMSTALIPGSEASNYKEQVQEIVQRNLRPVLGAQFTEKEGERLIARAYNPLSSEKENARRVSNLIKQVKSVIEQKKRAAEYFEQNGTLKGFKGEIPSTTSNSFDLDTKSEASTSSNIEDKISKFMQKNGISNKEEAIAILKKHGKI